MPERHACTHARVPSASQGTLVRKAVRPAMEDDIRRNRAHPLAPHPTSGDLIILYAPDRDEWPGAAGGCATPASAGTRLQPLLG